MGSDRAQHRGDRQEILRGVYEDNLRTSAGKPHDARPKRSSDRPDAGSGTSRNASRKSWVAGLVAFAVGAILLVGIEQPGATALSEATRSASQLPLPTVLTAPGAPLMAEEDPPSVARLYGLQLRTIVIDAGHGGRDPGAIGRNGLQEKEVTLDIARRLKARLEDRPGYRILLTRDRDETLMLRERVEFANEHGADLFISIHINSIPVDSIAPIETYYYGTSSDARAMRLAQRENQNSGYSVAEFNELTRQLRLELKVQESKEAAHSIQEGLLTKLRQINGDVADWGAKSGDFMVLLGVEAPGVLAEIGSISNGAEEMKLSTAAYREKLALFLEEGLLKYLTQHVHDDEHTAHGIQQEKEGV